MNTDDNVVSPEILCQAVRDVTGLKFDFTEPSDLAAAAVLCQKFMVIPELADELAKSIAKKIASENTQTQRDGIPPRATLRKAPVKDTGAVLFQADYPSESSSEESRHRFSEAREVSSVHVDHVFPFESGDKVADRNNLLVMYSPEVLGFIPETDLVDWSNYTVHKWSTFLSVAGARIPPNKPAKKKSKTEPDMLRAMARTVREKMLYTTEQKAKNYSIVNLEGGVGKSAVHFMYDPHALYVVVVFNEATTMHAKIRADEADVFAKNMVDAFGGHEDYAKGTLNTLSQELAH